MNCAREDTRAFYISMEVRVGRAKRYYRSVDYDPKRNQVILIDQRLLPHEFTVVRTKTYTETAAAILDMVVRGAPAIAAAAVYGLVQGIYQFRGSSMAKFSRHVEKLFETLKSARPTAVDPVNAMKYVLERTRRATSVPEAKELAFRAANEFANQSVAECKAIGQQGLALIRDGMRILTHCNAGWLACVDVGTVTAPIYAAHALGLKIHVYCSETRPRCQGSSLTAWELSQAGISHEIITDNAAGLLMAQGKVDLVLVGADRVVARTGEITNKIGTYIKAILAHYHKIPFYVAVPLSTFDWTLTSGREVPIEERDASEVKGAWGRPYKVGKGKKLIPVGKHLQYVAFGNPGSAVWNPGFDVTPPELIAGIVTPVGIFRPEEVWKNRQILESPLSPKEDDCAGGLSA